MRSTLALAVVPAVALACGSSSSSATGAGPEAGADAIADAGVEADAPTPACSETAPRKPPAALVVMPDDGQTPFWTSLQRAAHTIDLMVYDLGDGDILTALEQKAKAGVAVRVILDQSEQGFDQPAFDALKAAGAQVQWSSTQFTYMHAKTFVVDGREAVVSTGNFDASQMQAERNYAAVDDDAQDVAVLSSLFEADWTHESPDLACTRLLVAPENASARILSLIQAATKSLYVESMEFDYADVTNAVVAKEKAGLDVRVILAAADFDSSDPQNGAYLKSAGVPARWLESPVVHVKSILVDGVRAYLGSENLSTTSLGDNREIGVELLASGGEDVARMVKTFETDWAAATPY